MSQSIDFCESTRGVDNLFSIYKENRKNLISVIYKDHEKLIETLWKEDSPLFIDAQCKCEMGDKQIRTFYACTQCCSLRRLIDFKNKSEDGTFTIKCGKMKGKELIVTKHLISKLFLKRNLEAEDNNVFYLEQYKELLTCCTQNNKKLICVMGDEFTIKNILFFALGEHFRKRNMYHIPKLYTAFVCSDKGFSIYENPSMGGYENLKMNNQNARAIFLQLIVIFNELSTFQFAHSNPGTHSLLFDKEPCSYTYRNIKVKSPITVMLGNFWKASATFGNVHYYSKDNSINNNIFVPEIITNEENTYFKLSDSKSFELIKRQGFPLFPCVLDLYLFLISLMRDPVFNECVRDDPQLKDLWTSIWIPDQIDIIEERIETQITILKCVQGMDMRCDLLNHLLKQVENF